MDPVTITATIVTFATAVKDLVELGQKIHESFAKVSKNRRSAQRAADNIKDMINDINTIYKNHQEVLANMEEFDLALKELLEKFRGFEASVLPLVPQSRGSWISMAFLRGWRNNNKIKESILDLEANVREVKQRYMMKTSMRTEVKQEVNHRDTTRRLEGLSHGLDIVRADVRAMRVSTTVAPIAPTTLGTTDERERNIVLFVRCAMSKSTSLLRPPDEVTEEVWTTVFIKSQIHYIEAEVATISTLPLFGQSDTEPFGVTLFTGDSMAILCLRREVVRELMDLRNILSNSEGLQAISVSRAATQLNNICCQLSVLGLEEESKLFLNWTIKLARALVNAPGLPGEAQHRAWLAFYLYRLSQNGGDMTRCQQVLEEALTIAEILLSQNCTDTEIQGLCASILLQYAEYAPDNESAIKRCIQAIQLLEDIFNVETLVRVDSNGITGTLMNPSYDLVNHVFSLSPTPIMVVRCAKAFLDFALYMLRAGESYDAKRLAQLSIALRRRMVSVHGPTSSALLASALSIVCQGGLAHYFTAGELLDMVDECALLFRQLAQNNPVDHSQNLLLILYRKADILEWLNRVSDSISTQEEASMLAGQIIQDFGLQADALFRLAQDLCNANNYLDAYRAMAPIPAELWDELHKAFYERLLRTLQNIGHYKESAEAANHAITIYRSLALQRSDVRWVDACISAQCTLARSLILLGNEAQGIHTLKEAMTSAANFLTMSSSESLPADLDIYLQPFKMVYNVHNSNCDNMCIHLLEGLATCHPRSKEIFEALSNAQASHAYQLYCLGHSEDALDHIKKWNKDWATKTHFASYFPWLPTKVVSMLINTRTLSAEGNLLRAVSDLQSHRLASELCFCSYYVLISAVHEAQLDVAIGNWQKGLEIMQEALQYLRLFSSEHYQWRTSHVMALYGVAYAALHGQNYQQAMKAAAEGIDLTSHPEWMAIKDNDTISIRPSLFGLMSSAEANTGNVDRAMHYARQAVTLSLDIADQRREISATTAKQSLMETRGYLAEVLLATGDLAEAREICEERRAYFTERVKDRMGEYRNLAPILRMLGVLYCHEGRHEEGEAAARELTEMINRLGFVFPSFQEHVKIQLRYQASTPVLHVLDEMTERLQCDHQKGIVALFETELRTIFGPLCYHATSIF